MFFALLYTCHYNKIILSYLIISYDNDECIYNVSLLDLHFCLGYLTVFSLKLDFVPYCFKHIYTKLLSSIAVY